MTGRLRQRGQVAQHPDRRVEGADQVLAALGVDAGLAADRRVDHAGQRGRHLHDPHPAQPGRRRPSRPGRWWRRRRGPTRASLRVKPTWPSTSKQKPATASVLASSPSGTSITWASKPPAARSSRTASAVARSVGGWSTATRCAPASSGGSSPSRPVPITTSYGRAPSTTVRVGCIGHRSATCPEVRSRSASRPGSRRRCGGSRRSSRRRTSPAPPRPAPARPSPRPPRRPPAPRTRPSAG